MQVKYNTIGKVQILSEFSAAIRMLQHFKLKARCKHLKKGAFWDNYIFEFVGSSYHAHCSPDASEKEKCDKEEKENHCKRQRYCVEVILERNLKFSQHQPPNCYSYCGEIISRNWYLKIIVHPIILGSVRKCSQFLFSLKLLHCSVHSQDNFYRKKTI